MVFGFWDVGCGSSGCFWGKSGDVVMGKAVPDSSECCSVAVKEMGPLSIGWGRDVVEYLGILWLKGSRADE
jgi:hypothetical protein